MITRARHIDNPLSYNVLDGENPSAAARYGRGAWKTSCRSGHERCSEGSVSSRTTVVSAWQAVGALRWESQATHRLGIYDPMGLWIALMTINQEVQVVNHNDGSRLHCVIAAGSSRVPQGAPPITLRPPIPADLWRALEVGGPSVPPLVNAGSRANFQQ